VCQQRFVGRIVENSGHADTLRQPVPFATPSNPRSVDI
jgi:hypothetical protein